MIRVWRVSTNRLATEDASSSRVVLTSELSWAASSSASKSDSLRIILLKPTLWIQRHGDILNQYLFPLEGSFVFSSTSTVGLVTFACGAVVGGREFSSFSSSPVLPPVDCQKQNYKKWINLTKQNFWISIKKLYKIPQWKEDASHRLQYFVSSLSTCVGLEHLYYFYPHDLP